MSHNPLQNLEKLEADLWEAADQLRANSKLTSSDYFMPVLGIIFLRHAANRFADASRQIEDDQAVGRMPKRKVVKEDYLRRRSLWLPEKSRYDYIMKDASSGNLPKRVIEAMTAIEDEYEHLSKVLPKDYGIFEPKVLEDLMRIFDSEQIRQATGDVFGRIYEYFLAKFSVQKAHDNGEFFTPSSLVQTIVNVIEPEHGIVLDPASGSGGMFVQSSYFIERGGEDTMKKVVFYGQEKNRDTIRIAQMNLAVHGLEGKISEAITYYQDEHSLFNKCDFVMANPPFNVDLVDAGRVDKDPRLPFGLPGVNKQNKISNGNYLWISYFWSYLNEKGRAGFVMSSQASSAGHGEREVRRRIIETGDVDIMISIRSNFFYTRAVPCELWFFDRGKSPEQRDKVLMIDARNIYRKVTRKINDFSSEQLANIAAIVWLYRKQPKRFLCLVQRYLSAVVTESKVVPERLAAFETNLVAIEEHLATFVDDLQRVDSLDSRIITEAFTELGDANALYAVDRNKLLKDLQSFGKKSSASTPASTTPQHAASKVFEPIAERIRSITKQVDLLYKLATRCVDLAADLAKGFSEDDAVAVSYDRRTISKLVKQFEDERKNTIEQLRKPVYFHRQAAWLLERFPEAELQSVPGLVKLVDRKDIERADWSLTPVRYVGVSNEPPDLDFDFEQTFKDIQTELADLNKEAAELATKIQKNFEELGV